MLHLNQAQESRYHELLMNMKFDSQIISHLNSLDYDQKKALFDAEKNITETETEPIEPSIVEVRRKRAAT